MTGILLLLYYTPSVDGTHESIQFIMSQVIFGCLIRSVHSWTANTLVGVIFVHMFSTYFLKAYRRPRELTWTTGFLLLVVFLAFGFSGYLLPWNELSYFATRVGTDIAGGLSLRSCLLCFPGPGFGQKNSCLDCHSKLEAELRAPADAFKQDIHQQFGLGCVDCHGSHKILRPSNDMLGTGQKSVCIQCHESGSKGYQAAADLGRIFESLQKQTGQNEDILALAEKKGVEVSQPMFRLRDVKTILVSAKNLTHSLAVEDIREKAGEGGEDPG
jgi:predicted CXXCH cytochrome family protein